MGNAKKIVIFLKVLNFTLYQIRLPKLVNNALRYFLLQLQVRWNIELFYLILYTIWQL